MPKRPLKADLWPQLCSVYNMDDDDDLGCRILGVCMYVCVCVYVCVFVCVYIEIYMFKRPSQWGKERRRVEEEKEKDAYTTKSNKWKEMAGAYMVSGKKNRSVERASSASGTTTLRPQQKEEN